MQDKSNKEIWESYLRSAVIENSMRISDDLLDDENSLIDVPRHYDMKMRSMIRKYNKHTYIICEILTHLPEEWMDQSDKH